MLTPEQEKQRALKVSQLYEPSPLHHDTVLLEPFHPRHSVVGALIFSIPFMAFSLLFDAYRHTPHAIADFQAASILFIIGFFFAVFLAFFCFRFVKQTLAAYYELSSPIFWVSIMVVTGAAISLFMPIVGNVSASFIEAAGRFVAFSACIVMAATLLIVGLAALFHRLSK